MQGKEYLRQMFVLSRRVRALRERRDSLRELSDATGGGLSDVKVQTSPAHDQLGDRIALMMDLDNVLDQEIVRLLYMEMRVTEAINRLEKPEHRLIMYERYVNLKRWEDIAADNCYSWRAVHKIHQKALECIEVHTDM